MQRYSTALNIPAQGWAQHSPRVSVRKSRAQQNPAQPRAVPRPGPVAQMEALRAAPFILWEESRGPRIVPWLGAHQSLGMAPKLPPTWEGAEQALVPMNCSRWSNPKARVGKNSRFPVLSARSCPLCSPNPGRQHPWKANSLQQTFDLRLFFSFSFTSMTSPSSFNWGICTSTLLA